MDATTAISTASTKSVNEELSDFIERNKKFWQNLPEPKEIKGNVLLENFGDVVYCGDWIMQSAVLLNRAKGYAPLYFADIKDKGYYTSFVSSAKEIRLPKLSFFKKLFIKLYGKYIYNFKCSTGEDLLKFRYDGIEYGDMLYDEYIRANGIATFKKKDETLKFIINNILETHEQYKLIFKNKKNNIKAFSMTQTVGVRCTVPYRLAIKLGIDVYILTDAAYYKLEQIREYPRTPRKEEIEALLKLPDDEFNEIYQKVYKMHMGGLRTDAINAFNDKNKFYKDRAQFCKDYNLDPNKKNVFVMLHAFNDYPHSHFGSILFLDYYEWFYKTLQFAKQDKNVNWIFKQHPSHKSFKSEDVNYDELFKDLPPNVKTVGFEGDMLNSRSIEYVGDAVITCMGSCGFDVPAMFGIPSIIGGNNYYMGYDFSNHPKSQKEYFEALSKLKDIEKISPAAQKQARAMYIHVIYRTSVVPPTLVKVFEDINEPDTVCWSLKKAIEVRESKKEEVINFFNKIIKELAKDNFKEYRNDVKNLL